MYDQIPAEKRSALASELRAMPPRVLRAFKVPPETIPLLDALTATVHDLLDDDDPRRWEERLSSSSAYFAAVDPDNQFEARLQHFVRWIGATGEEQLKGRLAGYLSRFKNGSAPEFLKRLLGTKRFANLKQAAEKDWALALLAARRLIRLGLPLAQALEDAFGALSEQERKDFTETPHAQYAYVEVLLHIDSLIDAFLEKREMDFSGLGFPARAAEEAILDIGLGDLIRSLQMFLDTDMETYAAELSDMLLRKFRGFEQALINSDDGVGQAATSLIEMIDRLLRTAYTKSEVLAWVDEHCPRDASLVFDRDGKRLPTKKAEALCFAHAGQAPAEDPRLQEMLANSILRARTAAQKIKHADRGTPEEAKQLRRLMQASRGAFTFLFRMNWTKGSERYTDLQYRFAQAA